MALTTARVADPTFFPNRAAKVFYRPAVDKNAQPAGLLATGAAADNEISTVVDISETTPTKHAAPTQSSEQDSKPKRTSSTLDNVKDKLFSALPSTSAPKQSSGPTKASSQSIEIGIMGILHPSVLGHYDLEYPCSVFEFTVEGL